MPHRKFERPPSASERIRRPGCRCRRGDGSVTMLSRFATMAEVRPIHTQQSTLNIKWNR